MSDCKLLWRGAVVVAVTSVTPHRLCRAVHRASMSLRGVHASRVLLTSQNRLRITGAGVMDVLEVESKSTLAELQEQDVRGLVQLMLELATRNPSAAATGAFDGAAFSVVV